jgi:cysteine-rich repeat protein
MRNVILTLALCLVTACGDDNPAMPPECGDGVVNGDEGCDDGNTVDGDDCSATCTVIGCGDGVVAFDEACDDGNQTNGDGCDNNCKQTFCGNGIQTEDEMCDDGNTASGDGCDSNCKPSGCGNGAVGGAEACDDGNMIEGDSCDTNCTVSACGNGIKAGNETCDDGNTMNADGCSGSCKTETLEVEPNEDGTPSTGGSGYEGNDFGIAGADTNGALTTATTVVAAFTPAGDEDVFKVTNTATGPVKLMLATWNLASGFGIGTSCGTSIDTVITIRDASGTSLAQSRDRMGSDYCDDLTFGLLAGQTVYVHVTDYGDNDVVASYALDVAFMPAVCGDGDVGPGETCDDMNTAAGDGCSATCQIEGATMEVEPNEDGSPSLGGSGYEGNDYASANADTNGAITASTTMLAALTPAGDEDVFKLRNMSASAVEVSMATWRLASGFGIGVSCGTSTDTVITIRDAAGTELDRSTDRSSSDYCDDLTYGLMPGAVVYVHLTDYGDNNAIDAYALEIDFMPVVCGNNMVGFGEECDDGNTTAGDGCDAMCRIEAVCGDGTLQPSEQCDDGGTATGDGCDGMCKLENAVTEVEPNEDGSVAPGASGIAGNDFASANADTNGAFTTNVTIAGRIGPIGDEDVFKFTNPGSGYVNIRFDLWNPGPGYGIGMPCAASIDTGLHVRNAAGTSLASNDDRNGAADRCSGLEYGLAPGASIYVHAVDYDDDSAILSYALRAVYTPVVCGDNMIGPGEQCDDGGTMGGDGCSATCQLEGVIGESEPNDTSAQADSNSVQVSSTTMISGTIGAAGDLDRFRFTLASPTAVRLETFTSAGDCGVSTIDMRLFDSTSTEMYVDTEGAGIAGCGAIVMHLAAGTYYVQVEERGNDATVAAYFLQLSYQADVGTETEPNETYMQASVNLVSANDVFVFGGHLTGSGADVFSITVPAGRGVRAELIDGNRAVETCESLGVDSRLRLLDDTGTELATDDDDGRGYCSLIDGTGTTPRDAAARNSTTMSKTFYIEVDESPFAVDMNGTEFDYRLQVTIR